MYGSLFYLQNLADYVALNVRKSCRMRGWFRQVCIALSYSQMLLEKFLRGWFRQVCIALS